MSTTSDREYDEYSKTCSIIFGKANASQLQYLSASIELQQMWLTSCDSVVANQINWLEKYVKENNASTFFANHFLGFMLRWLICAWAMFPYHTTLEH